MEMLMLNLEEIEPSPVNPAARVKTDMDGLVESVRTHGVLQPILVRKYSTTAAGSPFFFGLIDGHRRVAAARAAGLAAIPAMVRTIDVEIMNTGEQDAELQLITNLQRADLHPLDEADGYGRLSRQPGYDVARIAERIGRSVAYVYDRLKLLALTKPAAKAFRDDRFSAGHAVLLARLTRADQARALDPDAMAVYEQERSLFDPEGSENELDVLRRLKPRSVRELQDWINANVRFDAKAPDPMLFPETALAIEQSEKVVAITHSHYIAPETRDGKTFGPRSWKRADGKAGSKSCEHAVTGFVAVGIHRGDAFKVCVAKDKCAVHWKDQMAARQTRVGSPAARPAAAPPAREQREDPKLAEAIHKAEQVEETRIQEQVGRDATALAGKMNAVAFMRILLAINLRYLRWYGDRFKLTLRSDAAMLKWIAAASGPDLQKALTWGILSDGDEDLPKALGFDLDALQRTAFEKVRAEVTAAYKAAQGSPAASPTEAKAAKPSPKRAKRKPTRKGGAR